MHGAFRSGHAGNNTPLPASFDTAIREAGYCPDFFTLHYRLSMPEHGNGTNRSSFLRSEEKRSSPLLFHAQTEILLPSRNPSFSLSPLLHLQGGTKLTSAALPSMHSRQDRHEPSPQKKNSTEGGKKWPESSGLLLFTELLVLPKSTITSPNALCCNDTLRRREEIRLP